MKRKKYSLNIQFHMLPDELLEFLEEMSRTHEINLRLEHWFPKKTRDVAAGSGLVSATRSFGYPDRIWLVMDGFEPKGKEEYMMLNFGGLEEDKFLSESQLGGDSYEPDAWTTWKEILNELRRRAPAGGWLVDPDQNQNYFYKTFHISPGAAAASREGKLVLKEMGGKQFRKYITPDEPSI